MNSALTAASLRKAYAPYFFMGAAINSWNTDDPDYAALIRRHFNSITAENEMKPVNVMDLSKTLELGDGIRTVQNFERTDRLLAFARDNGLHVRFHVLCWHGQTSLWFFTKNWEDIPFRTLMEKGFDSLPAVSRDVMLERQEAYIRDVMTHVNTLFPGVVYCWDVVNEAIDPGQGGADGYRVKSPWYQVVGDEFVPAAFRAAKKYKAPGQKLFYNDYECYAENKLPAILKLLKRLQKEDLVDGMGMQGHLMMDHPDMKDCEKAARAYAELGLTLQTTELDIHCPDGSEAGQRALAERYAEYFSILCRLKDEGADVNSVTFWGLTDRDSWLPGFRHSESYPLLFTGDRDVKPAFDAVIGVPGK